LSAVGQARVADRYWLWADAADAMPRLPAPSGLPESRFGADPVRAWLFYTTAGDSLILMTLSVVMPQGSAADETAFDVHAAADVFMEMLKRISFEPLAQQTADRWPPDRVLLPGHAGLTIPRIIRQVKPAYTVDAMRAHITGSVFLECVVETDGSVGPVRVRRSLDAVNGLDEEAVKAAKQWRFTPAMKDGMPVRMLVQIELTFSLRDRAPASSPPDGPRANAPATPPQ
jgi:TonB family protein